MFFKRICLLLLVPIFLFFYSAVKAHQTASSGSLEATIHISPEDQPITQQLSKIQIHVNDSTKNFNFSQCSCVLEISTATTTVAELPLLGEGGNIETTFTFADSGYYNLKFRGQHTLLDQNVYPFEMIFSTVVTPPPANTPLEVNATDQVNDNQFLIVTGGILLSLLSLISLIVIIKKRKQANKI